MVDILFYVFLGSIAIQTLFWVIPWIAIGNHKLKENQESPAVSVIVCAHNELNNLKELIPALEKQEYSDFEIIIVDDRSDDGTYDFMLETQSDKIKQVTIDQVHNHISAKKYAITLGVKAAKHDTLLFIDADCRPSSTNWIKKMTQGMTADKSFALGISQYEKKPGLLNKIIRFETQFTAFNYMGWAILGNPYMGVGRNLCYSKSLFLENKGFNKYQDVIGGDDDILVNQFATGKTTVVVIDPEATTVSIPKNTFGEYLAQKIRHVSVSKFYKSKDKMLLGFQNLSNVVYWLSLFTLAVTTDLYIILGGVALFRALLLMIMHFNTSKKFGDRINIWLVPVFDAIYVWFISIVGLVALFTKKVKWK
ncbi:MAG: glycosyltransferase [Reichenbachiella sp.]